jgi:hypothetical protein
MTIEERLSKLEKEFGKLKYPLDFNSKKAIEESKFSKLHILTSVMGLPIFTVARTIDKPKQGEIYLTNITGTAIQICAYIDGVEVCSNLT